MPSSAQVKVAVNVFALLAEPTRLRILWALSARDLDVSTLASLCETMPAAMSQHLAKLRLAGLVTSSKVGRRVLYRARDSHVRALTAEALFHADHQVAGVTDHD
jgi:DNA-binding transcriptional ArsR family regulator